ncbi:MAG: hypothetical protein ACFNYB_02560 [Campylobacter sp.]
MPRFCLDPYCGYAPAHESEIFALLRELLLTERSQAIMDDILRLLGDYRDDFSAPQTKISAARPHA